jgi:tetratricopeptide (TPR) repeat protein
MMRVKKVFPKLFVFLMALSVMMTNFSGCQKSQPKPEAVSLLGEPLYPIELSPETKAEYEANLAEAKEDFDKNPDDPENIIWLARRTAYLWRYREAIDIYSKGIEKYPDNAELYRHRGHRYITIREFDKAIADLEKAAALIQDVPDEVEADGLPNEYNIPTSTSHSNIWYHLGLAYYLKGDFENALRAYLECMKFSKNNDMLCATTDWLYMTYRRLGRNMEAIEVVQPITEDMRILENFSYHKRLLMYKGLVSGDSLLSKQGASDLDLATQGYGVGNYYYYNNFEKEGIEIFRKVLEGDYWAAFGYIAAEAEMARIKAVETKTRN